MDLICAKEDFFKNPNKVPLNKLFLNYKYVVRISKEHSNLEQMLSMIEKAPHDQWSNRYQVKTEKKPALDKCWLNTTRRYVEFQQFHLQFDEQENSQFLSQNVEFLQSLQYLVNCTFHQLWCNIVCEPRASLIIKDFLRHAMVPVSVAHMSDRYQHLYNQIYYSIYRIYERLLNFNLSKTEYMEEEVVRKYLRDAELVNVRSIYAFSFIYNHTCPDFVKRLVKFYFGDKHKATYTKEVNELLMDVMHDLDKFGGNTLGIISDSKIPFGIRPKPDNFDPTWLEEMSLYALELTMSLNEFLKIYKPAVEIAFELELPNAISHVYKHIYSEFDEMYENESNVNSRYKDLSAFWIPLGKSQFLELFHQCTAHLHEKILKLKHNSEEQNKTLEAYLELISVALDDDLFIRDYNLSFPIEAQLHELTKEVPTFDKTQSDYLLASLKPIISSLNPNQAEAKSSTQKSISQAPTNRHSSLDQLESIYDTLTQYLQAQTPPSGGPSTSTAGFKSKNLPEPVIIALKQYVRLKKRFNGLPTHQPANVHQENNINRPSEDEIEKRIKVVLEMLPELDSLFILNCLEQMDFKPEQVISRVLDGDLPNNLMNMGYRDIIPPESPSEAMKLLGYVGKKPGHQDALTLLNEKNEDVKNFALQATNKYDLDDDYDERDEIYGSTAKGFERIQQTDISEYAAISDPSSSSEEDESRPKPSLNFCEDPSIIRARREAERGRNHRGGGQTRNHDVIGKPKNQPQEATVLQNRSHKNVHKSTRGNHNRRGGAQFKRSRGMIPS